MIIAILIILSIVIILLLVYSVFITIRYKNRWKGEYIICSAMWYKEQKTPVHGVKNIAEGCVTAGHRHPHAMGVFIALTGKRSVTPECGEYVSGFITSKNRFVDRKEALQIALSNGQCDYKKLYSKRELYSEDIY